MPFCTWIEWLNCTKSGRSCTRVHSIGLFSRQLARTGSRISALVHTCEWQVMHVLVDGIPANFAFSTVAWQYRQSIPSPDTWCSWLNGTGCSRATSTCVTYGERLISATIHAVIPARIREPKIVPLAMVLLLGWKIWAIRVVYGMERAPP